MQQGKLSLLRKLNQGVLSRFGAVSELEGAISNYELAFRMQAEVPGLLDLSGESDATKKLYGLDEPDTEEFGRQLILRRTAGALVEMISAAANPEPPPSEGVE